MVRLAPTNLSCSLFKIQQPRQGQARKRKGASVYYCLISLLAAPVDRYLLVIDSFLRGHDRPSVHHPVWAPSWDAVLSPLGGAPWAFPHSTVISHLSGSVSWFARAVITKYYRLLAELTEIYCLIVQEARSLNQGTSRDGCLACESMTPVCTFILHGNLPVCMCLSKLPLLIRTCIVLDLGPP